MYRTIILVIKVHDLTPKYVTKNEPTPNDVTRNGFAKHVVTDYTKIHGKQFES